MRHDLRGCSSASSRTHGFTVFAQICALRSCCGASGFRSELRKAEIEYRSAGSCGMLSHDNADSQRSGRLAEGRAWQPLDANAQRVETKSKTKPVSSSKVGNVGFFGAALSQVTAAAAAGFLTSELRSAVQTGNLT